MPELPEVESARLLLETHCLNKKIVTVTAVEDDKVFEGATPAQLEAALAGRTVTAVKRKGKNMWMELDGSGPWPLFHFGMTGSFSVRGQGRVKYRSSKAEDDPETWPPKFCKLQLELAGGASAAYCDPRRFGRIRLQTDPLRQEPLCKLGFDPLLEMPTRQEFETRLKAHSKPSTRLKALLLDQEFSAGVGNWVADEVLYQARLHPEHPVAVLTPAQLDALHTALHTVVQLAVEVDADSDRFPADWLFHYRWTNKKASSIGGRTIEFITAGGRTSAYVPALQKLPPGTSVGASKAKKGKRAKAAAESDGDGSDGELEATAPPAKKRRGAKAEPAPAEPKAAGAAAPKAAGKKVPAGGKPGAAGKKPAATASKQDAGGKAAAASKPGASGRPGKTAGKRAVKEEELPGGEGGSQDDCQEDKAGRSVGAGGGSRGRGRAKAGGAAGRGNVRQQGGGKAGPRGAKGQRAKVKDEGGSDG